MIEVESVSKVFARGNALNDVTLTVEEGEICGLIGPNGAGKTTLLRILATVLKPTGGTVRIAGLELPAEASEVRRRIGYMPDNFGTYEELRVDSYLEFFAHIYDLPRGEVATTISDILTLVDLLPLRHAPIGDLSLGVRQRLSIARVLLHNPRVLLLDEPVSGLDPRARVEIRALLRELGRMGKAVLISSHILTDLTDVCDRFVVLDQGSIVFSGTLGELQHIVRERRVQISVADRGEEVEDFLKRRPWAQSVKKMGPGHFEVELTSDEILLEEVSRELFEAGYPVTRFIEREVDLEEAFLRLTRGELT